MNSSDYNTAEQAVKLKELGIGEDSEPAWIKYKITNILDLRHKSELRKPKNPDFEIGYEILGPALTCAELGRIMNEMCGDEEGEANEDYLEKMKTIINDAWWNYEEIPEAEARCEGLFIMYATK